MNSNVNSLTVIPKPYEFKCLKGRFVFKPNIKICCTPCFLGELKRGVNWLQLRTGITFKIESSGATTTDDFDRKSDPSSKYSIYVTKDINLSTEEYYLQINEDYISIIASTTTGVFYALQTLRQLLPKYVETKDLNCCDVYSVPALEIRDLPRFSWRGMHLDVARSFMSMSFIKRFLDILALHKMNRLHLHLTDDQGWRIEIKSLPKLTESSCWRKQTTVGHALDSHLGSDGVIHGGFYTQHEIQELVEYAEKRHITIVPEIDLPGHMAAFLHAYPEYGCTSAIPEVEESFGIFEYLLCPSEKTFSILNKIFAEIAALFPGEYIHIGGDEVVKKQWEQSSIVSKLMQENDWYNYEHVHGYFITRVSKILNSYGKKAIGWDDILQGGNAYGTTIMCWQSTEVGRKAVLSGHDVIMTPSAFTYFDFYQSFSIDEPLAIHGCTSLSKVYHYEPVPKSLSSAHDAGKILGVQGQLWSEYFHSQSHVEYMALPRLTALAEVAWSSRAGKDWYDFSKRLTFLLKRFDVIGLEYSHSAFATTISSQSYGEGLSRKHHITLQSELSEGLDWYYTTDGSSPVNGKKFTSTFFVSGNTLVRAHARCISSGRCYSESIFQSIRSKLIGAKVSLNNSVVNREWNSEPESTLVNGISRTNNVFHADEWAEFPEGEMIAEIDTSNVPTFKCITLGYTANLNRHFLPPNYIGVWSSEDGVRWDKIVAASDGDLTISSNQVSVSFPEITSRYLKLVVTNRRVIFDRQSMTHKKSALFLDQIAIL
ncbi:MAG: family 20 glycosylhydrolase [Paraglaciecola sp.]|uniref:beta-N-acetylhexosaminidase n=4 Tax=Paraglaciecola sp. TaxID=1920173 RepID=UPI003267EDD3